MFMKLKTEISIWTSFHLPHFKNGLIVRPVLLKVQHDAAMLD
mgnify:CR=1 FL=1